MKRAREIAKESGLIDILAVRRAGEYDVVRIAGAVKPGEPAIIARALERCGWALRGSVLCGYDECFSALRWERRVVAS